MKPDLGKCRKEEIEAGEAPDYLSGGAGGDATDEGRRSRAVDGAVSATGDFMKRAIGEPAAWQLRVDLADPERQDATR
ncbi:hypothetical protein GGD56_006866 [Rhizobium mongolense]|uniref:Uncharacterized protein n=1 Tax=Rhizobium mongolense TaxID=57676 RepID=A0ABR6IYM1_9HYPH|nr:hypothetical protein [Rhizobium mongolense]